MLTETTYHPEWQKNRIKFILSKYPKEFFENKKILELGSFNGYIGAYFQDLGAQVHCIEGRQDNVLNIKNNYPQVTVECFDLDTSEWVWGRWDIIINFGLYYHLENYHKEHLINCINNCDLMFFESVIYDSNDSIIYSREESGNDQSLGLTGGTPSTSYIEDIFKSQQIEYTKYSDSKLNGNGHLYDWPDTGNDIYNPIARRFWITKNK